MFDKFRQKPHRFGFGGVFIIFFNERKGSKAGALFERLFLVPIANPHSESVKIPVRPLRMRSVEFYPGCVVHEF